MLSDLEQFYMKQEEPIQSCLLALKKIILQLDKNMTTTIKYGMPFFCYNKKMFCYFWKDKKTGMPYIGIVEGNKIDHPLLEKGQRSRMKILRIDPTKDLPIETIHTVLTKALSYYK